MTQTQKLPRRAISVRGTTYQRLKAYADATHQTLSGTLEKWIAEKLDVEEAKIPLKPEKYLHEAAPPPPKTAEVSSPTSLPVIDGTGVVEF